MLVRLCQAEIPMGVARVAGVGGSCLAWYGVAWRGMACRVRPHRDTWGHDLPHPPPSAVLGSTKESEFSDSEWRSEETRSSSSTSPWYFSIVGLEHYHKTRIRVEGITMTRWTMTVAKVSVELSNKDLKVGVERVTQQLTSRAPVAIFAELSSKIKIVGSCEERVVRSSSPLFRRLSTNDVTNKIGWSSSFALPRQLIRSTIPKKSLARLTLRIASHCGHRVVVFIQTYEKQYLRGDRTKLVA
ncbi:hypothetical protein HZH68_006383 [Vespula germanica]|uniref:Uncharacterized protein n=1 Tax=Vespula germanica TaxID=30212 RepID=A0A834KEY1_VESGE|nr:hypothetical protein HZH68_006383 [Vespula germanica]